MKDLFTQRMERSAKKEDVRGQYTVDDGNGKKLKVTLVDYDEFSRLDHTPAATWYVKDATGIFIYIHTSKRHVAQAWIDHEYGAGRYTVNASKIQKGKPLGEGSCPAFGTSTRRGQKR